MDRRRRAAVATFYAPEPIAAGGSIALSDDAVQHARVRRVQPGDAVRITNGRGSIGEGTLERLTKGSGAISVEQSHNVPAPAALALFVPVADKERMLWLAEKSAELGISTWQPVLFRRSASVSPRGEGAKFLEKVRARMISALEQSGGAWLPEIHGELSLEDALVRAATSAAERFFFEQGGAPLVERRPRAAAALIGPEGGVDEEERTLIIERHGWLPVSLGDTTLRFETAGVLAAGMLRALLARV